MSITSPDPRLTFYNPVAATKEFAAAFPVFDNSDLAVYHNGVKRTDFSVTATYGPDGYSINARCIFAKGIVGAVVVVGAREPRRTAAFKNGATLPIRDQNIALDTLESEIQELRRDIERAFKGPYGGPDRSILPGVGGQVPVYDGNGNLVPGNPGGGNMFAEVYDPRGVGRDVFDFASQYRDGISTDIDFLACGLSEAAVTRFNLTRQGTGNGNVVQSFVEDTVFRDAYSLHVTSEKAVINKFDPFGPATQTSTRWVKTPNEGVGHQGLAVEYTDDATRKFWGSVNYAIPDSRGKACRFSLSDDPGDATGLLIGALEIYTLFNYADGDGSANVCISPDGRILVAKVHLPGNIIRFNTWLLKTLIEGGPGDYTNQYVHSFDVEGIYDVTNYPTQGVTTDGVYIYSMHGYGDTTGPYRFKRLGKFTLDGSFRQINTKFVVGLTEALGDGTGGHYEPENLYIARHAGRLVLAVVICSGNSGARVTRVWYLDGDHMVQGRGVGARPSFLSTGGNDYGVPLGETLRLGQYDTVTNAWTFGADVQPDGNFKVYGSKVLLGTGGVFWAIGAGSPEGALTGPVGSSYWDTTNGTQYNKKTGTGNTGWKLVTQAA